MRHFKSFAVHFIDFDCLVSEEKYKNSNIYRKTMKSNATCLNNMCSNFKNAGVHFILYFAVQFY